MCWTFPILEPDVSPPIRSHDDDNDERQKTIEAIDRKLDSLGIELAIVKERLPPDVKVRLDRAEQTLAAHKWGLRSVGGGVLAALGGVIYKLVSGGGGPNTGH